MNLKEKIEKLEKCAAKIKYFPEIDNKGYISFDVDKLPEDKGSIFMYGISCGESIASKEALEIIQKQQEIIEECKEYFGRIIDGGGNTVASVQCDFLANEILNKIEKMEQE